MKHLNVFLATLVLTCFALLPAGAFADDLDDLEVTMDVLDDMSRLDDPVVEMRGPGEGPDFDEDDSDDGEFDDQDDDESGHDGMEDENEFEDEMEDELEEEFEEEFDDELDDD